MRPLILIFVALAALAASAAEQPAQPEKPSNPLWDGHESVAEYAKRAGLEPTKTLDLGGGVTMEMVLIPAGKFVMGTEEPKPVDEEGYRSKILTGQVVLAVGGGVLAILVAFVATRAIRKRQRPQYSLAWFLCITVATGIGLLGGLHWRHSMWAFDKAKAEYEVAKTSNPFEKPAHEVTLTQPFYAGKCEVTQEQYEQVMATNPSGSVDRNLPVEQVSWNDAEAFCKKAGEKTGLTVRLPTEAEWEYACRAGTRTAYCSGDDPVGLDGVGWSSRNSDDRTHPVGQKVPNAWGLYDMHGNVSEWCEDWYAGYSGSAAYDPTGAANGESRLLRGGSWQSDDPWFCRSACRIRSVPHNGFRDLGFRVVMTSPPKLAPPPSP